MVRKTSTPARGRRSSAGRQITQKPHPDPGSFPVVGIGASAGGIEAFSALLRALDPDAGMAYVFVLHMNPSHHSVLGNILSRATTMPVHEVTEPVPVRPNNVYVVPADSELSLKGGALRPVKRQREHGTPGSIDRFFSSLAEELGPRAIGVVLSGNASDGTAGLHEIKAASGVTFAQDGTAVHESMPESAVADGCVDFVLAPDQIAAELARIGRHPYLAPRLDEAPDVLPEFRFEQILDLLREATGVDFTHYKRSTLQRRISRRLMLSKARDIDEYTQVLMRQPAEIDALYQDLLINVTRFFRDPDAIEALKSEVFPALTAHRSLRDPLRVWVVGCSTGQEAYSISIAVSEFMESTGRHFPVQIFATDLNGAGIERARAGMYPRSIADDMSAARLRRHFVEEQGGYRIRKNLRDMCVFARHNILTEPPFSRIDLVSCRNLLIYLDQDVQHRIIPALHYALRPEGFLWLGSSETVGLHRDLFDVIEQKYKIYRKKAGTRVPLVVKALAATMQPQPASDRPAFADSRSRNLDPQREAERLLISRYAPANVLVDAEGDILHFGGNTGLYLSPAPGRASLNLFNMLREGLLVGVRSALGEARKSEAPVRKDGLAMASNGGFRSINIEVIPVKASGGHRHFLLVFNEPGAVHPGPGPHASARPEEFPADAENIDLKQELAATREYLQAVIEQQEAANEELQSANEEIQSANEELQSINEELETSKEEIQSTNEELSTVNDELSQRNAELMQSNNDLTNLLSSVQMAIVMLGHDLRIRRFTPTAEKMLSLIAADIGRPIRDLNLNVTLPGLEAQLEEVMDSATAREFEVPDKQGRWHLLRLRPYLTREHKIDGVVVVMIDIDAIKRSQETLRRQARLLDQAYEPILAWEFGGSFTYCNQAAEKLYGYSLEEMLARRHEDLLRPDASLQSIEKALERDGRWAGRLVHMGRQGQPIHVDSRMVLVREEDGRRVVIEANRPLDGGP
jgi:two-component system, chemotaxis family, CheB/CheR fusion protein